MFQKSYNKMAMFGLTWNPDFMRSRAGMTMVAQVIVGAAGGVLSLLPIPLIGGNSYESFIFWTSFFISGFFLLTHMTNLTQSLESKVPQLRNIVRYLTKWYNSFCHWQFQHLLYLAAWSVMIVIAVIYRFVVWNLISVSVLNIVQCYTICRDQEYSQTLEWTCGSFMCFCTLFELFLNSFTNLYVKLFIYVYFI